MNPASEYSFGASLRKSFESSRLKLSSPDVPFPVHDPGFRAKHRNPAQFCFGSGALITQPVYLITQPGALITQPLALVRVPVESTCVPDEMIRVPAETTCVSGDLKNVPVETTCVPDEIKGVPGEIIRVLAGTTCVSVDLICDPVESTRDPEDFVFVPGLLHSVPVQSPRQFVQQGRQKIVLNNPTPESIRKTTFFQPLPRESNSVTGQLGKGPRSFCTRLIETAASQPI